MEFMLVLDGNSATGRLFLKGTHDGLTTDGTTTHPVLRCHSVQTDMPMYLQAEREIRHGSTSHQQLLRIPHSAVLLLVRAAATGQIPPGFVHPD